MAMEAAVGPVLVGADLDLEEEAMGPAAWEAATTVVEEVVTDLGVQALCSVGTEVRLVEVALGA